MPVVLQKINPPTLPDAPAIGYSQITVVEPGKMVFISGQIASRRDGGPTPDSLEDQTEIAMRNLAHALESVGGTMENVAAMRVYVVDLKPEHTGEAFAVMKRFLGDVLPTMTVVGVTALAAAQYKIEIEATAVV